MGDIEEQYEFGIRLLALPLQKYGQMVEPSFVVISPGRG